MSKIVFLYNPRLPDAEGFATHLVEILSDTAVEMEVASVWDEATIREIAPSSDFVVTLGGDGTVLRATRIVAPLGIPIVGVNLGKLGFLTELGREEAARKIPQLLHGRCWTEERIMLSIEIHRRAEPAAGDWVAPGERHVERFFAANEIVVGRAALARAVEVVVSVNGVSLAKYIADGAIVSTPTGSTAYSLAAGGPVLHPSLENLLLTPILPHLSDAYPLVTPPGTEFQLEVHTGHQASVTIDGQIETPLYNGDLVRAFAAPQKAGFLRTQSSAYFYRTLVRRLRRNTKKNEHNHRSALPSPGAANPASSEVS
ncbi:MAG: NAD(+)/NADH kinase [Chloroflexi bacterium]|nr:NAD(+)/NADH kinase [Chloroflexota bacterium]